MNLPRLSLLVVLATALTGAAGCPPVPPPSPTLDGGAEASPTPPPPPPSTDDGGPAGDAPPPVQDAAPGLPDAGRVNPTCAQACAVAAALGCAEGKDPGCGIALTHVDGDRLMAAPDMTPITCARLAKATSPALVLAGGIGCTLPPKKAPSKR